MALGIVVILSTVILIANSPSNVVSSQSASERQFIRLLFPQGWAFFTRPSDDPEWHPYAVDDGAHLMSLSKLPNSRSENYFGISRAQRAQGPELASIVNNAGKWMDCKEIPDGSDCLHHTLQSSIPVTVTNIFPDPTLCGVILISETVPVPWSYRHQYDGWRIDEKATLVDVQC